MEILFITGEARLSFEQRFALQAMGNFFNEKKPGSNPAPNTIAP
jgi:hypothetical protein